MTYEVVPQYISPMSALIGSTGFVGGHLQQDFKFTHTYNRANIFQIQGLTTDLLICAGLPAEKWKANNNPESDWANMASLAQKISSVSAETAILISTIDVYQPAIDVTEEDQPNYVGEDAYGRNRAWFEAFFISHFSNSIVIRLPGLFGSNLKKNFIFDLVNNQSDQFSRVNPESKFQFYDIRGIWSLIEKCIESKVSLLNVATEPVFAQEIASIFNVSLKSSAKKIEYRMKSKYCSLFNGSGGFLQHKTEVLKGISKMRIVT
jgi:dTDP-4-dehydrorhamnose reductase